MSFQSDWDGFFSNQVAAGTKQDLGNGSWVTKNADGTATYGDVNGGSVTFNKNSDTAQLAQQATGLGQQWASTYGWTAPAPAPAYSAPANSGATSSSRFQSDWDGFFSNQVAAGTRQDLGNGSWVTKNADGTATYGDNAGRNFTFNQNTNQAHVGRNAPGLQDQWSKTYVTDTYAPGGAQQRTDPAATGFRVNADGTVTRNGISETAKPGEAYGDYTTRININNVKNAEARAYYQANPDAFLTAEISGLDPDTYFIRYFYNTNYGRPAGEWGGPGASSIGGGGASSIGGGGAATTRPIDAATETIEGRIQNLLAVDAQGNYKNAMVQQAREAAERQFAGRGLLNSSIAQEAAMQAAISKAIEIAGPDAQAYFSQGRANQDTLNTFKRDEIANQNDMAKLDKQLALEREKLTVQGSQFNQELAYKYDALKLGQDSQIEAEKRAHEYALEIKNIDAVNAAYDLYLRRIQDIDMNKDLTAENKQKMKNDAGKDFDLYAKAKGISWQMGLGDRFSSTPQASQSAANDSVENGLLYSGGGGGV